MDNDELIRKYQTDRSTLSPEVRALVERMDAETDAKYARGEIASPDNAAKQTFPIGLDDNYNPFLLRPRTDNTPDE